MPWREQEITPAGHMGIEVIDRVRGTQKRKVRVWVPDVPILPSPPDPSTLQFFMRLILVFFIGLILVLGSVGAYFLTRPAPSCFQDGSTCTYIYTDIQATAYSHLYWRTIVGSTRIQVRDGFSATSDEKDWHDDVYPPTSGAVLTFNASDDGKGTSTFAVRVSLKNGATECWGKMLDTNAVSWEWSAYVLVDDARYCANS